MSRLVVWSFHGRGLVTIASRRDFSTCPVGRCSLGEQQQRNLRSRRGCVWSFDPLSRRKRGEVALESERASGERRRRAGGKANSNLTNEKVSRKSDVSKLAPLMRDKGRQRRQAWAITICKKKSWQERKRERKKRRKENTLTFIEEKCLCVGVKGKGERKESSFSLSKLTEATGKKFKGILEKVASSFAVIDARCGSSLFPFERFQNDGNKRSVVRTWNESLIKILFSLALLLLVFFAFKETSNYFSILEFSWTEHFEILQ